MKNARRLMIAVAVVALPLSLSGCNGMFGTVATDVNAGAQAAQGPLTVACTALVTITNVAGLVPGVGAIEPYVTAACRTAEGFAKLLADPTSLEWVGKLEGNIQTLAKTAGLKV